MDKSKEVLLKDLHKNPQLFLEREIVVRGWVRTNRIAKNFGFIELNDGTAFHNFQIVYEDKLANFEEAGKISLGSSIEVSGFLIESPGQGQTHEIKASEIKIIGFADLTNPIQKKKMTFEFLRTIPHLRSRTNTFMAVFRVRSLLAHAIHKFFQERDFVYIHTPIITATDAEGAGQLFSVSTLDSNNPPRLDDGKIDFSQELLGRKAYLTVSGQLAVEPFCLGFRNVYTFGPTFRAENSNTPRHANEFWMIEPEIAFADLEDDMQLAEDMMKYIVADVMKEAPNKLKFFNDMIDNTLLDRLEKLVKSEFERITYTDAIKILTKANQKFEYPVNWGMDIQTEHERYLAEKHFNRPVFVTDYPKDIKAFYMRLNEDQKTVRAMDLLVPGVGEIIGGSQREERYEVLMKKFEEHGINIADYEAYIDIRKYGTFPHAGFGLGFERALMYITGMKNIRDVIPYPRTPNNALS
jgi:asparaginyl-tRNA synthetase